MLDGREAGIAVHVPHALADDVVDIGMYVDPVLRRRGVGSSILALTARRRAGRGTHPGGRLLVEELGLAGHPRGRRPDLRRHDLPAHLDPDVFADAG